MPITQETANLIDTLAHAASQIGSTAASAKLNETIVDILPNTSAETIKALQLSERLKSDNVDVLRGKLAEIHQIASEVLPIISDPNIADDFRAILTLAAPIPDEPAA